MTPGELLEVARGLRKLGAAGFTYKSCQVTFFEPLPVELQEHEEKQRVDGFEESDDEDEDKAKKLARLRKAQAEADLYGSA